MYAFVDATRSFFEENRKLVTSESRIVGGVLLFVRRFAFLLFILSVAATLVSWQIQLEDIGLEVVIEWARTGSFAGFLFALSVTLPISFREDVNTERE